MSLREDFNRDGYVVVSGVIFPERVIDDSWNEIVLRDIFNQGTEIYIDFLKMSANHIGMQQCFTDEDVCGVLYDLGLEDLIIPTLPVLHVMSPALRIPGGYYGTAAHQDWPSTQGSLDCVTVWIALTDSGIGNFPLEVIPGSHLDGLREGKMNGSVLEVEADDKEFIPIECKAGDVVFLSGFLVHKTGSGSGFRVSISQRFDNGAEPTFIERGYPCAQKRTVDREIRWRPTVEQVRRIFS